MKTNFTTNQLLDIADEIFQGRRLNVDPTWREILDELRQRSKLTDKVKDQMTQDEMIDAIKKRFENIHISFSGGTRIGTQDVMIQVSHGHPLYQKPVTIVDMTVSGPTTDDVLKKLISIIHDP